MKRCLPLALLVTLIACGKAPDLKSSTGTSNVEVARRGAEAVKANTVRGMVEIQKRVGKDSYIYAVNGEAEVINEDINETSKSIVLKIDGNLVYRLTETTDADQNLTRKVELNDLANDAKDDEMWTKATVKIENDQLTFSMPLSRESTKNGISTKRIMKVQGRVNLSKPCETQTTQRDVSNIAYFNGLKITLPENVRSDISTCERTLTSQELKAIDLTFIAFCDTRAASPSCEDKDLSYLTSDL